MPGDTGIDAAAIDAPADAMDAPRMPALNCVDAGDIPRTGGNAMGTTGGRQSLITASCGGFVMNGPDAVYRVNAAASDQFLIGVSALKVYVIAPCKQAPETPSCLGNLLASPGNPISVTAAAAGDLFIVVDHENPATSGAYELTVTKL